MLPSPILLFIFFVALIDMQKNFLAYLCVYVFVGFSFYLCVYLFIAFLLLLDCKLCKSLDLGSFVHCCVPSTQCLALSGRPMNVSVEEIGFLLSRGCVSFLSSGRVRVRPGISTSLAPPTQPRPHPRRSGPAPPAAQGRTQEPHGGAGHSQPVGCATRVVAVMPGAHVGEEKHRAGALRLHLQALGRATAQPAGDPGQGPGRRTPARGPLQAESPTPCQAPRFPGDPTFLSLIHI